MTHKFNVNQLPPDDFADMLREHVMPAAPRGMYQVHLGGGNTGAEANELAMSVALTQYSRTHGVDLGKLCVVGFDNSHHGSTTATLSCSSLAANPHGLPAFPWPKAQFPQIQYPYANYEHENAAEEERCLQGVRDIIEGQRGQGKAVGAIIIEPISSINNQIATPNFYKKLRVLAKAEGIPFIVDETKTGMGATGKNWAHEWWYLHDD